MKMARSPGTHYHGPHLSKSFNNFYCIENTQDKQQYIDSKYRVTHYRLRNTKGHTTEVQHIKWMDFFFF